MTQIPQPSEENTKPPETMKLAPEESAREKLLEDMHRKLAEKDQTIEKLKANTGNVRENMEKLAANLEKSVLSYRNMVLKAHPEVPGELVNGKSVEEIDLSLEQAGKIIERVKEAITGQAAAETIPVGAPVRNTENPRNLDAREKIQYALGGDS